MLFYSGQWAWVAVAMQDLRKLQGRGASGDCGEEELGRVEKVRRDGHSPGFWNEDSSV